MEHSRVIAERLIQWSTGEEHMLIRLFQPRQLGDRDSWETIIEISGTYERTSKIVDVDAFGSLAAALRFLNSYLLDRCGAHPNKLMIGDRPALEVLFHEWALRLHSNIDAFHDRRE